MKTAMSHADEMVARRSRQRARVAGFEPSTDGSRRPPEIPMFKGVPGWRLREIRARQVNFLGQMQR